ncbi:hypothetical protein A8950_0613 [Dongia mobilis]|uniref:Uncharacterized protein n=2 Tax=Dongia mobilis TaxID=578943 RepID=A0A4R6WWK8_9PROT|nr:hypothetical protein A8950_0613 [Dongia mobilis]
MQHIAIFSVGAAAIAGSLLLGWLWQMASAGAVPAWLKRIHENEGRGPGAGDHL